mgnify:CR=1 FL=1
MVEQGDAVRPASFDTAGGEAPSAAAEQAGRIVTIVAEAPGARYFVVEPDSEQLLELAQLAGGRRAAAGDRFDLSACRRTQRAFARSAARGKHGKVVLRVIE